MNASRRNSARPAILCADDLRTAESIRPIVEARGFKCRISTLSALVDNFAALHHEAQSALTLIIAPTDENSIGVVRKIRSLAQDIPLICLLPESRSAPANPWLDAGCDDVLKMPNQLSELESRHGAIQRRRANSSPKSAVVGNLKWEERSREITVSDHPVTLTNIESEIVSLLFKSPGRTISKQAIADTLYGFTGKLTFQKSIDVHIFNIRAKIKAIDPDASTILQTIVGRGYRIKV